MNPPQRILRPYALSFLHWRPSKSTPFLHTSVAALMRRIVTPPRAYLEAVRAALRFLFFPNYIASNRPVYYRPPAQLITMSSPHLKNSTDSDSPFEQYFDSDYAPTPSEILRINELIDDRQAMVNDVDARTAELDRMRQELEDQREVRGLPPEIKFAIFEELHWMETPPSSPHPSVALSHVCHQWRRVALAMPLLWTRINISTPTQALPEDQWLNHVRSSCDRAATFIRRAREIPLHIAIIFQDPSDDLMSTRVLSSGFWDVIEEVVSGLNPAVRPESAHLLLRVSERPRSLSYTSCVEMLKVSQILRVTIEFTC